MADSDREYGAPLSDAERAAFSPALRAIKGKKKANAAKLPPTPPPGERVFVRGDDVELAHALVAELADEPSDLVFAQGDMWQAKDAVWQMLPEASLKRRAMQFAGCGVEYRKDGEVHYRPLQMSASRVSGTVSLACALQEDASFFASAAPGIPFRSGFYRVAGRSLTWEPLDKSHRIQASALPSYVISPYGPDEMLPRPVHFDRLLHDSWAGCADRDERVRFIWEWIGAALAGITTRYKCEPMLVGKKDTGKSTVLAAIVSLFPEASRRTVALHDMSHEYHRARLSGGRINMVNELPSRELMDGESAKAILSGDTVSCRHPSGRVYEWTPRCANIFAANDLPPSRDNALMERFCVLDFHNVVLPHQKDSDLPEKLAAEAPLIAFHALAHLQVLLERGHMLKPESSQTMASQWAIESNTVHMWADEHLEVSESLTPSGELFAHYRDWCKDNGFVSMSVVKWAAKLEPLGFEKVRSNGSRWGAVLRTPARQEAAVRWRQTYSPGV